MFRRNRFQPGDEIYSPPGYLAVRHHDKDSSCFVIFPTEVRMGEIGVQQFMNDYESHTQTQEAYAEGRTLPEGTAVVPSKPS
jgi:hypothetical protein